MANVIDALCNKCCNPASMMCQRCHEAYCSADCQVLDWKDHKSKCHQMPNLVPIRKLQLRSGRTLHSTPIESSQFEGNQRSLSRNPLRVAKADSKTPSRPLLEDKDFALKPKTSTPIPNSKAALPKVSSSISSTEAGSNNAPWKKSFAPPQGKFFEAFVQWFDRENDSKLIWVTEMKYDTPLRKLMMDINRSLKNDTQSLTTDFEIEVGDLVAAPLDDLFYRAEVLEMNNIKHSAKVRLIDYGNQLTLDCKELRPPIPIMRNLNAYAICVRLSKDDLSIDWQLETVVSMRVLSVETPSACGEEDVHYVELKAKSIPLHLPLDLLSGNREMLLKKVFIGGQTALLQFDVSESFDEKMNAQLNGETGKSFNFSNDQAFAEGSFLAACTSKGWRRCSFLGYCPQSDNYLVYLLDDGQVEICKEVKKIPEDYLHYPMRIIAITVSSTTTLIDEAQLRNAGKLSLRALATSQSPPPARKNVEVLPCALYVNTIKVGDVVASTFSGMLSTLNVKCWTEQLKHEELVYITNVVSQAEVFISATSSKAYSGIFTEIAGKSAPYDLNESIKDEIVLAAVSDKNKYFRAKILDSLRPKQDSNSLIKVLDIDTGIRHGVPLKSIRKPNLFVRSCPVFAQKVKLINIDRVLTPIKDNKAVTMLKHCQENHVEFILHLVKGEAESVDLVLKSDPQQSLSKQLLPLLFEKNSDDGDEQRSNESNKDLNNKTLLANGEGADGGSTGSRCDDSEGAEDTPLPPSPPDTPINKRSGSQLLVDRDAPIPQLPNLNPNETTKKIYTLEDVEIIPISNGEKVPLSVLDASTVGKGYITAADCSNQTILRLVEQNLDRVKQYGKCPHLERDYEPEVNEICLTLFEDDGEWYRALCINKSKDDGVFHIMFLDFGNMCFVTKKNILPITKDLLFASNANLCMIENFPINLTKSHLMNFLKSTLSNPIIHCQVKGQDNDTYKIKIHNIEKYFAQ